MLSGAVPTINGDGKYIRDYVYVEDVAEANLLAVRSDVTDEFNIGTGAGTDVNQLYKELAAALNFKEEPKYGPARAGDLRKNIVSYRKAESILKWTPKVKLKQGLEKTVEYFKSQN
jgi:UDP-glucose 4-epimerase